MKHDGILQKTLMVAVTALMLCALAGLALASTTASGTWGTCAWTLDSNGTLTVGTGTGVDNSGSSPWSRYSSQTKKIIFESGVVLPANCYNLFSSMNKLESVDFSGVDASRVTSIRGMFNYCSALKSLDLTPFASATLTGSQTNAFSSCSALQSLDVSMLNTRGATDLSYMFYNCRSLKQLTLGGFSTASATTLNRMFYSCAALESLDLSGFDTRNVVQGDASYSNGFMEIFRGCDALHEVSLGANTVIASSGQITTLGLPDGMWRSAADGQLYSASVAGGTRLGIADTYTYEGAGNVWGTCAWELDEEGTLTVHAGVGGGASGDQLTPFRSVRSNVKRVVFDEGVVLPESCAYLFQGLMNMRSVDFTGVDASRVKYIASMFDLCLALRSVDLAPFAQASLTGGQSYVFNNCSALTALDVSMLNTQNVTNVRAMFMGCSSLEQITFGGFSTASVTDVTSMFAGCEKLETLDLSGFDTRNVTNWGSSGYTATLFSGCNALKQISFGTNTVLTGSVTSLGIPAGNWRAASDGQIYTAAEAGGTRLGVAETYTYAGASGTWGTCPWELDIDGTLTVHPGTGANNYSSSSSPWYTYRNTIREIAFESGVILPENCNSLFYYFNKLERVDFSGVDASAVTSISNLFYNCSALTEVDLTPFASAALSGYHPSVFEGCSSLETLDVSMLNTRAVTDMSNLFRSCGRLREISFGDMSTASVIAMAEMFASCSSLEVLDLSGFDTRKVTMWNYGEDSGCSNMFDGCKSLGEITLGENVIIPANASNNVTHLGLPGSVWRAASDGVVYTAAAAGGSRLGTQETYTRVDADASGVWGTCAWTLKDGTLTVHPGAGANNYSSSSPWYTYRNTIREIVYENGVVLPAECGGLFYDLDKLERVDFSGVDASAVTSIRNLFYNCSALTDVDMAPFASAALSGNQYSVFAGCSSLEALDVSMLNTRAVTGFSSMFWDCRSLRELQLGAITTAEATDLSTMFSFCESLETLDLSGFDTRKVTMWNAGEAGGASNMFEGCSALRVITLGEHVVIPANADNDVTRLGLPEGNWQAASDGQIYTAAEAGGTRLGTAETYTYTGATGAWGTCEWELDPQGTLTVHAGLGEGLRPWNAVRDRVRRVVFEDGVALPADCSYLFMFMSAESIDFGDVDTSRLTTMTGMFEQAPNLRTLDLSGFDTHGVTNMTSAFGLYSVDRVILGENFTFKGNADAPLATLPNYSWRSQATGEVYTAEQIATERDGIADTYTRIIEGDWGECHWTLAGRNLTVGAGVGANTAGACPWAGFTDEIADIAFDSGVVFPADASRLFAGMSGVIHIDLTDVDTSATTNMSGMFEGLTGLTELNVTGFDTSNVTDMSHMFEGLTGLTELNVTGFNTSGVTDMSCLFDGMSGVRILDLTGFDTGAVSTADGMFDGMTGLEEVHVGALLTFGGGMALPEYEINGHADWFSVESVRWLGAAEIASGRGGIADTYCKQARGAWGTAPWTLDESGLLTVSAGEGAATGNSSPWASLSADITAVSFEDGVVFPSDSRALLRDFAALEQVSLGSVDTASVTDLSYTFAGCASLQAVNLAGLDLNSVTNMAATFMGDAALEVIDLTGTSMSALKMMINTFQRCESLKTLDLSGINAMGLTRLNAAFSGCAALETLDLSGLGTGSATSMSGAFLNCESLHAVTLGEAFSFTGAGSTALTTLPAGSWLSAADGEAYTEAEIAAQRSGIVDTYTRVVSLEGAELTWGDEPLIYNGEPQKPQLQVTLDGVILAEDEDYTVEYPEDITSAGHVTVTIRGINAYSGTLTGEYVIAPAAIDDATLTLENDSLPYTGEALEPEVLVLLGSDALEPADYTVAYADNVNAGNAKVIVTGVGNYTGEVTETFTITPLSIEAATVVVEEGETIYSGEAHTPAVKVMLGEAELDATAYTVTYADNVNAGTATITVAGKGNYTGRIGAVFTIQPASIATATVKVAEGNYIYSGEPHTPAVQMTLGETELAVGDYTVAYADNVNAGTAKVTVTGTGNYTGEAAAQFEIAAKDMSGADVLLSQDSFTYTGGEMKPDVTVMLDADVLEEGLDYATTYQDNVNAGTAKVIVTGVGNYTGSVETPFTIAKVDISGATLLILDSPSYTGEPQEPEVLVALGSDDLDDSNYTVAYADNVNAGTARVTVTGVGNYTGTLEELFEILPRSISGMTLQVIPSIVATDGEAVEPRVILIDGEMTIAELDVTYADNMAAGTGRVTVRASGNYTGSKSGTFTIVNRSELTTLTLPAAIRTIEAEGFAGTAAQRVVIPAQCENIDSLAFEDCRSLVEIDILSDTVSIAEDALDGNTDVTIRAHAGSAAAAFADANGIRWIPVD